MQFAEATLSAIKAMGFTEQKPLMCDLAKQDRFPGRS